MKSIIIKSLLKILNSAWLNATPAKYAFVGNVDNFSREYLDSNVRQSPHLMVRELLRISDQMKSCPLNSVIEADGTIRPMNDKDIDDLQNL